MLISLTYQPFEITQQHVGRESVTGCIRSIVILLPTKPAVVSPLSMTASLRSTRIGRASFHLHVDPTVPVSESRGECCGR